jgi:hypothetical protein
LVVALQLAGPRVQDDDAARVEIVALAVVADEVRAGVSDRRVKQPGLGVDCASAAGSAARAPTTNVKTSIAPTPAAGLHLAILLLPPYQQYQR